ncbi:hypothetical protein CF319_g1996 [Tilletia indica]|uniref:Transmembrane protein 135 N-terminal domain-containing protein n=1 Tax=Tilletia indica TaxID=43049 RepID=A0A177TYD8_9BASI|nr:hypothetical protein CF319_g1996 [Tilletia indica]KAE8231517.1 hypothetical protein CF326_g3461 [Tilletia indica]KAE8258951.1 hypothetical protein A4X13_0g1319 [Tilletia indica]
MSGATPPKRASFTIGGGSANEDGDAPRRRDPGLRLGGFTQLDNVAHGINADGNPDGVDGNGDDEDSWRRYATGEQTPNISEAAEKIRRSLSVASLHDLAHMKPKEIRKQVTSKVWRAQDEQVRIPSDWERLAVHVVRGAIRAGNLAFSLRVTMTLVLGLIKALRTRKFQGQQLLQSMFGIDAWRFAGMFSLWAALYKATHNSLRLVTPFPAKRARSLSQKNIPQDSQGTGATSAITASASTAIVPQNGAHTPPLDSGANTPRSGYTDLEGKEGAALASEKNKQRQRAFMRDPRSKIWHAYVAGGVSALAVLAERKETRVTLAQQLFVRGLEGSYNVMHAKKWISIPHGAVLVFGIACGQIMYAWLHAPDTLPRSYVSWITQASHVAPTARTVSLATHSTGSVHEDTLLDYFPDRKWPELIPGTNRYPNIAATKASRRGITGKNVKALIDFRDRLRSGHKEYDPPCAVVHPWENSHFWSPLDRFIEVTRWILPVYLTLHFVPAMFLRTRKFLKDPLRVFLRSIFGAVRSSSFLGVFVIIFQTYYCTMKDLHEFIRNRPALNTRIPTALTSLLVHPATHWFGGFLTAGSLFVDDSRRRAELAAYVLPKGLESAWFVARKRSYAPAVPGGDLLLTSIGMAMVMGTYAQNPDHLSGLVRRVVYQFVGRN